MPRPSPNERRRIEARRKANEKLRLDAAAHDERVKLQVEKIVKGALGRPRTRDTMPDLHELIERLWSAYDLAMASGQAKSAVDAVMAVGKLTGLLIDRSAVAVGDLRGVRTKEEILAALQEHIGEGPTRRF